MKRSLQIIGFVAAMAVALVLPGQERKNLGAEQEHKPSPGVEVKIDNFSFGPAALTLPAGTKVTWTNHDDVPHNVISNDKLFASPVLDTDEKFSYTFAKPGTYVYYCSIHPKMTARVVVQ